ncbi:MAG: mycothiol conjugate amidase Mca [Microbacteriaceae bacterium]|nr:mycothiol conjugate amidase Mca [Microbacteriaceae bacterium]
MSRRLLAVHAHPDDESSKGAATYAHYVHSGARVAVVSCTGGERGDVQNHALVEKAMAERDMAGLRRIEMARAQAVIGFEHYWLGYEDSGLPEQGDPLPPHSFATIPLEHSAEPLVKIIRELRPQVMITYDETGGYPHPDHIRTHDISMYAMAAAADPHRYPHTGPAWQIQKVYYERMFNSPRANAMFDAFKAAEPDSPRLTELEGLRSWMRERPNLATTHVHVAEFFPHRDEALRAHASQVSPDSTFFFWPNDLQREVWPWEDFQLATSLVSSDLPEHDLFAGIVTDTEPE